MDYNLPWVEKYRPSNLNDVIGQENIIKSLKNMLDNGSLPHLLFYGSSGVGKTTIINALLDYYYGKKKKLMTIKLDASDDRGINTVREEIKSFAEKKAFYPKMLKVIILDEADSMTFDAQFALRRIIEKYSSTTRFCLICNYDNKIIKAIKSRCVEFKFRPLSKNHIIDRLQYIIKNEKIKFPKTTLDVIYKVSNGDLRRAINLLQSLSLQSRVTKNICYKLMGYPTETDIKNIYKYLTDTKLSVSKKNSNIKKIILDNGYSLNSILTELIDYVIKMKDEVNSAYIFIEMSKLECYVGKTTFNEIYISYLISIFHKKNLLSV